MTLVPTLPQGWPQDVTWHTIHAIGVFDICCEGDDEPNYELCRLLNSRRTNPATIITTPGHA